METQRNEEIYLEVDGHIGSLVINRPALYNALDTEVLYKMDALLAEAEQNKDIRALIVTSTGEKSFVAGANIRDLRQMTPEMAKISIDVGHQVFARIERFPVPTIAAINGHCLGGGLEIAMSCDLRVCVAGIKLGLPEANVGMIPGWGGTVRLQRIIGQGRAKEMILLGKAIDPETAKSYGLVSEVCENVEALRETAKKMALRIASLPPHVMRLDKEMIHTGHSSNAIDCAQRDALALAYCFTTEDSIEGLQAFLDKRKPEFKGK